MVRAHMKPSEEKKEKETPKKRTPGPKKKTTATGVWPCKINGCNKQFAREADLKRHQRTTKVHSTPSFACPQCDATFTRTDALRRHQKSRHNGIVIDPTDADNNHKEGENNEPRSPGSGSRSRSGSPTLRNKGRASSTKTRPTALALPGTAGPAGSPSSYYRQHAAGFQPPRPPQGVMMDPQFPQGIALPTSATRLHQTNWHPPHPWTIDAQPPAMGQIAYHQVPGSHPIYYQPTPYYRTNGTLLPSQTQPPHQPQINAHSPGNQNGMPSENDTPATANGASRTGTPTVNHAVDPRLSHSDANSTRRAMDINIVSSNTPDAQREGQSYPAAPVIDPSLDASTSTMGPTDATDNANRTDSSERPVVTLTMTQAAVEAVLKSVICESKLSEDISGNSDAHDRQNVGHIKDMEIDEFQSHNSNVHQQRSISEGDAEVDRNTDMETQDEILIATQLSPNHGYHTPLHLSRPEPMEHILTEDGEPMLNPAELLTQESLASPPPS